ncbi:MAG TPA: flagellar motor switch phosphatase FliY, partial [Sediminispirochaeta sp.]|nr:flagellar motor switch phosphatase FliY [Sediminispirochaeta sp.]
SMDFGGQEGSSGGAAEGDGGLSEQEKQAFSGILAEIVKSQASNLSSMIGESVSIEAPSIEAGGADSVARGLPEKLVEIKIDFSEGLSGFHSYLLPEDAATTIAGKMMGQEEVELNEAAISAVEEAGNTLAGSAATSLGDLIGATVMSSPGSGKTIASSDTQAPDQAVKAVYSMTINDTASTQLIEVFDLSMVKQILSASGQAAPAPNQAAAAVQGAARPAGGQAQGMGAGQAFGAQMGGGEQMWGGQQQFGGASVQPVQFPNLNPQSGGSEQGNIGLLMDVYMEMTVELGRTRRLIKDILGMGEGTIIELDKLAGEPVDILVNHKLIARGEVVVIDENFGVRVTEIVSPMDRVEGMT